MQFSNASASHMTKFVSLYHAYGIKLTVLCNMPCCIPEIIVVMLLQAMLVVVGHPVILSADENWQVLLRHCLSRGAYRGYGRDRVPVFLPSSSALKDPFWDSDELDEELDARERNEMDNAIERIAEMSLLGLGDVERLYPDTLDSYYAANSEDQEWRVVL